MGYYTNFTINKIEGSDEDYRHLKEDILKKTGIDFIKDETHEAKWYKHEADLTKLTKKYPGLLVQLDGNGENWDDLWATRFRNGETETFNYVKEQSAFSVLLSEEEKEVIGKAWNPSVEKRLTDCLQTLRDIAASGYIPFASPAPCSNEVKIKEAILQAVESLGTALYHHKEQFGNA